MPHKTQVAESRRNQRSSATRRSYVIHRAILSCRCVLEGLRYARLPPVHQASAVGRCSGNYTMEVRPSPVFLRPWQPYLNRNLNASYPYLTTVNSVLPAIISGNAVLLKPSPQTPLTAERFALALKNAGVPPDIIQVIHLSPELTSYVVQHPDVNFVSFTGSVPVGHAIAKAAANNANFPGVGLEVRLHSTCSFVHFKPVCVSWGARIRLM